MVCRRNQSSSVSRTRGQQEGTSPARMIFSGANRLARLAATRPRSCAGLLEQAADQAIAVGGGDQVGQGQVVGLLQEPPARRRLAGGLQHRDGPADDPLGGDQLRHRPGLAVAREGRPAHLAGQRMTPGIDPAVDHDAHAEPRAGRQAEEVAMSPAAPPEQLGQGQRPDVLLHVDRAVEVRPEPIEQRDVVEVGQQVVADDAALAEVQPARRGDADGEQPTVRRPPAPSASPPRRRPPAPPPGPARPAARPPPAPPRRRRSRSGPCGPAAPPGPRPGSRRKRGSTTPAPANGPAASGPRGPPPARPSGGIHPHNYRSWTH